MHEKQSSISSHGGKRDGAGRKAGVPNKISGTVRDNVISVFEQIGGTDHMRDWALENPNQFYNMYAKLLPLQLTGDPNNPIETISRIELVSLDDSGTD